MQSSRLRLSTRHDVVNANGPRTQRKVELIKTCNAACNIAFQPHGRASNLMLIGRHMQLGERERRRRQRHRHRQQHRQWLQRGPHEDIPGQSAGRRLPAGTCAEWPCTATTGMQRRQHRLLYAMLDGSTAPTFRRLRLNGSSLRLCRACRRRRAQMQRPCSRSGRCCCRCRRRAPAVRPSHRPSPTRCFTTPMHRRALSLQPGF